MRGQFRVHLERNPRYECHPMMMKRECQISSRIWKGEGFEKRRKATAKNRKVCNTFNNVIINLFIIINFKIKFETFNIFQHFHRLSDTSKATKERQEKIGQQKLGPGGYSNLVARIISIKKPILHPNNKLKIIFVLLHHKM